jgi:effector-binding domain-containing protein
MKILKYLFFLLLIFLIGAAIYFATKDGSFDVAATRTIEAPAPVIYDNVKDFKNWQEWGPWMAEDSDMEIDYAEKTEGEGASYSWTSEEMGDGAMKTVKVIPNKEINQEITFNTPLGDSDSDVYWRFEETETPGQTKVVWGMKGEQSFMEKVFMAFQDEDFSTSLKAMFEKGLDSLAAVVKEEMAQFSVHVDGITNYGGTYYLYNTTAAKQTEISDKMKPMFQQISSFMEENNLASAGKPFAIYNQIDKGSGTVIFSAAIPVRERIITPEGSPVVSGFMEPSTSVKTTLRGKYDYLQKAYAKAESYMAENGLEANPAANMFEVYVTDPEEVPNPANWVTEIYIPIVVDPIPNLQ